MNLLRFLFIRRKIFFSFIVNDHFSASMSRTLFIYFIGIGIEYLINKTKNNYTGLTGLITNFNWILSFLFKIPTNARIAQVHWDDWHYLSTIGRSWWIGFNHPVKTVELWHQVGIRFNDGFLFRKGLMKGWKEVHKGRGRVINNTIDEPKQVIGFLHLWFPRQKVKWCYIQIP